MTRNNVVVHVVLFVGVLLLSSFSSVQADTFTQGSLPDFDCYRTAESIYQTLENLEATYQQLIELTTIGLSWEGQPIIGLKLTNHSIQVAKPRLVVISGLRGNSFAPAEIALLAAEELLASYNTVPDNAWLLDYVELHMVILANPDGRMKAEAQAQEGLEIAWQNNTHNTCSGNDIGVRLNLNFPFEWRPSDIGACDPAYPGVAGASEPETQAIITNLQALADQPEPILLLHLDSFGNEILSPFLFDPVAENPNASQLFTLAKKIAYNTDSVPYAQGGGDKPPVYGTLLDFAYGELGMPALVMNLGMSSYGGHSARCWYFNDYLKEQNKAALLRALKLAADPYRLANGPDVEITQLEYNTHAVIIAGSADDRTNWYGFAEAYSPIERVDYSVDLPLWDDRAAVYSIENLIPAEDADWISYFNLQLGFASLSPGKHRLFFQAWDTEDAELPSNPGPVTAIDILIPYRQFLPLLISQ